MNLSKVIRKRLRGKGVAVDLNAVIAVNTEPGSTTTRVSNQQRVVQRSGRRRKEGANGQDEKEAN